MVGLYLMCFFKSIKTILLKTLTIIFNKMLLSGICPEQLKIAKIIPLYEKGDRTI